MLYAGSASEQTVLAAFKSVAETCCASKSLWKSDCHLNLNERKTEVILIGTETNQRKISNADIILTDARVPFSRRLEYLVGEMDHSLTVEHTFTCPLPCTVM